MIPIRDAKSADLARIVAIERESFGDPWSEGMFMVHFGGEPNIFLVALGPDNSVIGYAVALVIAGTAELFNIAVTPTARGLGVGRALLETMIDRCCLANATELTLEVRESNAKARALYEAAQFNVVGRRRRYYQSPVEDALLLSRSLVVEPS